MYNHEPNVTVSVTTILNHNGCETSLLANVHINKVYEFKDQNNVTKLISHRLLTICVHVYKKGGPCGRLINLKNLLVFRSSHCFGEGKPNFSCRVLGVFPRDLPNDWSEIILMDHKTQNRKIFMRSCILCDIEIKLQFFCDSCKAQQ